MHRNLELQTHGPAHKQTNELNVELRNESPDEMTRDWISAFNTSLLTTLNARPKDHSGDLSRLMQSPEFASLLVAAQHLADSQGLTMEESTDRLIRTFREMDEIWNQIVIERGLKSIVD